MVDDGSIIPLVFGFWLLAVLFVAGAVATSDVFTRQRALQSICDGAALAAANNAGPSVIHGGGAAGGGAAGGGAAGAGAIPLASADSVVRAYLNRDPQRASVSVTTRISADGTTVELDCRAHNRITFGAVIAKPGGVDQRAYSSARSPLLP